MELNDVPDELLLQVFAYLGVRDIWTLQRVCFRFNEIVSCNVIWKMLCNRVFLDGSSEYAIDPSSNVTLKDQFKKLCDINFQGSWTLFSMREFDQEAKYITTAPVYLTSDLKKTYSNEKAVDFNGPNSSFNDINPMKALLGAGKALWGDFMPIVCQWGQYVCCVQVYINSSVRTLFVYESTNNGLVMMGGWFSNWYNLSGTAIMCRKAVNTTEEAVLKLLVHLCTQQNSNVQWEGLLGDWEITFTRQDGKQEIMRFSINNQRKCGILGMIKGIYNNRKEIPAYRQNTAINFACVDNRTTLRRKFHDTNDNNVLHNTTNLYSSNLNNISYFHNPSSVDADFPDGNFPPNPDAGISTEIATEIATDYVDDDGTTDKIPIPMNVFRGDPNEYLEATIEMADATEKPSSNSSSSQGLPPATIFMYDDDEDEDDDDDDEDDDEELDEDIRDEIPGVLGSALGKCVGLSFYTQDRFITCTGQLEQMKGSDARILRIPPYEYIMRVNSMHGYFMEKRLDVQEQVAQGSWKAVRLTQL